MGDKRGGGGQDEIRDAIFGDGAKEREDAEFEEMEVVEPPVEDLFQIKNQPDMAQVDLRIIKATAQYVAMNGQSFLQ